ncbi:hypothetical protein WJX72_007407 [[Myrmecia] bisecta]|uniref:Uncharacterized protein n=1 Tax=[Myrmecia] bisecta TaxID=41462 RepID=A0AAW1R8L6_9CHLO
MKPNQLETLRQLESHVEVGKVLFCSDSLAIVDGLNNDAPVGTMLSFVGGASGALLWRRSDNICIVLVLGGSQSVEVGEAVECRIKAILQVVDAATGAKTKREYEICKVPAGNSLAGEVVDFLGRPPGSLQQIGTSASMPLFNSQLDMDSREQIFEPLVTGVKAVDALTPLGRGQALMVTGLPGTGKTSLAVDAVLGQRRSGVRCFYAAVGLREEEQRMILGRLQRGGATQYTTLVTAPAGASLGERYAAICSACSMGERLRDAGQHVLVVLDDISCIVQMWERITVAMAELSPEQARQASARAAELDSEQLVEYEGMLVSAAAAQRRQFFSSLIQRSAKVHRRLKGGSMTLLLVLPGTPATGQHASAAELVAQYKHLSPEQKAKLEAALRTRQPAPPEIPEGCLRTEVIEEFMSIADGQAVLERVASSSAAGPSTAFSIDPQASISRIGSRAYPAAMAQLAPHIRFELAQAVDAQRYTSDPDDPVVRKKAEYAARVRAALVQHPCQPVPLEEQVVCLYALQKGLLDTVKPSEVAGRLEEATFHLRRHQSQLLSDIAASQQLTPATEDKLSQEVMQAVSDPTVDNFRRALQHLEVANYDRFVKIKDVAKEQAAGGGESDLRRLRRQFASLKNTFMHYDVKESFIDGLADGFPDGGEHDRLDEYEQEVHKNSEALRHNKENNAKVHQDIVALIEKIAATYSEFEANRDALVGQLDSLAKESHEHQSAQPKPLPPLEDGPDEAACNALLSTEAAQARTLEAAIAAHEAEAEELTAAIYSEEEELQALRAQVQRAEALKSHKDKDAEANTRFEEAAEWCDEAASLLTLLGGVSLLHVEEDAVHLLLSTTVNCSFEAAPDAGAHNVVQHELSMRLQPGTASLASVELRPADADVADIGVAAVQGQRRLDFVVREVQARLAVCLRRQALIEEAHQSFPMQPVGDGGGQILRAVLPCGVEAELQVPSSWPAAGQTLSLLALQAATTKVDLLPIQQQLQADAALAGRSLMDFLSTVSAAVAAALA